MFDEIESIQKLQKVIFFELQTIVMADCREIKKEIHRTIRAFLFCTLTMSGFIIGLAKLSYAGFLIF